MILNTLKNYLVKYPETPIVVAYSGGIDSQVLLHAVSKLEQNKTVTNRILAIHVNHGLSPLAEQWQNFCKQQCQQLSIEFQTIEVEILNKPRTSIEAQARDKRYQVLENLSPDNALILTGHHQDDQVETFFLSLKRGSGLKGLSAMGQYSSFGNKSQFLLRPLLNISRAEIELYAKEHNLKWIEDESNSDISFDRNFLRRNILPQLKERWSNFNGTVSRSIQHCQDAQQILDEIAAQDLTHCLVDSHILDISSLLLLSQPRFNQTIRFFIAQHNQLMPSVQQLFQLHEQLSNAGKDKSPEVKLGDIWLRRFQDKLYLTADQQSVAQWQCDIDLSGEQKEITLPDHLGKLIFNVVDASLDEDGLGEKKYTTDKLNENEICSLSVPKNIDTIKISFSHGNPKCLPDFRHKSRSFKKVLQELFIPPWERKRLPLLYVNDELAAVVNSFVCQPFLLNKHQRKIKVHWVKKSG